MGVMGLQHVMTFDLNFSEFETGSQILQIGPEDLHNHVFWVWGQSLSVTQMEGEPFG